MVSKFLFIRKALMFITICLLYTSCVITKTQYRQASDYFQSLSNMTSYCTHVTQALNTVQYQREMMTSSLSTNDSVMIENLSVLYEKFYSSTFITDSFKQAASIFENYINGFAYCIPKPKQTTTSSTKKLKAVEDFSSYIPLGIGLTIYKTVYDFSYYTINAVRVPFYRKRVKDYILKGKDYLPDRLKNITKQCLWYSDLFDNELLLLKEDYRQFLKLQKDLSSYELYSVYNPIFQKQYRLVYTAKEFSKTLSEIFPLIDTTYTFLYNNVEKRNHLKEIPRFNELQNKLTKAHGEYTIVKEEVLYP